MTPAGIRDGERGSLLGLLERRGPAVLAFCEAVCTPEAAVHAAAEAFARFRAAVAASDDPGALAPEPLLLSATRHAAASLARQAPTPPRGRVSRRREAEPLCPMVPALLAQRADDMLAAADLDALSHHLDEHADCRGVEAAFRRAERAFRSPPDRVLPAATEDVIYRALVAAAPVLAPAEDADVPVLLDAPAPDPIAEREAVEPAVSVDDHLDDVAPEPRPEPPEAFEELPDEDEALAPAEPDLDEDEDEDDDLADWEPVPAVVRERPTVSLAATAPPAAPPTAVDRPSEGRGARLARRHRVHVPAVHPGPVFGYVLPGAALLVALIIILAVAGVFGGDGPAPGNVAGYP